MAAPRRLARILNSLNSSTGAPIGQLKLGNITYEITDALTPSRLPSNTSWAWAGKSLEGSMETRGSYLLDPTDEMNAENLYFILQKYLLGQDIFLVSQPGPYARRLALTFASLLNLEYEYVALHRDVGETELKQGREIRDGGSLAYVDSPAVSAVKHGRLLILEGIEKAERGIMPILNNLLENREMNLDDGTHIIHQHRYDLLEERQDNLIPAHKNFRVIAIAAPVPPYPGYPLDPPFRSRFQARFIDPLGALLVLSGSSSVGSDTAVYSALRSVILATQYSSESRHALDFVPSAKSVLPAFPQTALLKLRAILAKFPPDEIKIEPSVLAQILLTIHPGLIHAQFQAWGLLAKQIEETGTGLDLGSPSDVDFGLCGYIATSIERISETTARVFFCGSNSKFTVSHIVPCGPQPFRRFPLREQTVLDHSDEIILVTPRFIGLLTTFLQAHVLGWDISYLPPLLSSTASTSTSTLVRIFAEILGYELETIHLYKELGGREIIMRRRVLSDRNNTTNSSSTTTTWEPSPLIRGAWSGKLVWLEGIDVIAGTGAAGSLSRFVQDREIELWEGRRIVAKKEEEEVTDLLTIAHPSFRLFVTASKSLQLRDWLSDEHANMFFTIPSRPMSSSEERTVLVNTGCDPAVVDLLLTFAEKYRQSMDIGVSSANVGNGHNSSSAVQRNRKLGTRTLIRISKRVALFPQEASQETLRKIFDHALLSEFLPTTERMVLNGLLEEVGLGSANFEADNSYSRPPFIDSDAQPATLIFPPPSRTVPSDSSLSVPAPSATAIPLFDPARDPTGSVSLVPYMDHFHDNALQTGLMRDLAVDMEIMGENLVLLGNQGVGKNKIVDRLCQLLRRPREYIQLHRDSTVSQLMFTTSLVDGVLTYSDSALLRAIRFGRIMVVDEADKAPEHVVAVFRSLAGRGELTLSDGRRVRKTGKQGEKEQNEDGRDDIIVHKDFRLVLLANRPGYPFLGNHFLQVLGESFSPYAVSNPDQASERKLLQQLAPDMDEDMILRFVGAFADLRKEYEMGKVGYPYSLRELINLVRHIRAYPSDSLDNVFRNVFDFDVYKPETIEKLREILDHHGLRVKHLGIDAAREGSSSKAVKDVQYIPKSATDPLKDPKEGEHDDKQHVGGNRYAGGVGGRETAGLGGRGGYKRLYKGGDIKQLPETVKREVPEEIREKAREMARQELLRRLEELDMSEMEAKGYGQLLQATQSHMLSLFDLLENLAAKEEERIWVKRQTDGELDDSRLTEGITGEPTVYKRRTMEKPETGKPQIKPKRIRFIFDLSASMYRFQYDGRLQRSMETAVMLMETFDRLSRKDKYVWDMCGHSGDEPLISLVTAEQPPTKIKERWKVTEKMYMIPQYAFAGDNTVEAIQKGVDEVAKFDADDWFVIIITDANFGRYQITPEEVLRAMKRNSRVHTALICIGEGADAQWIEKVLPGSVFRVKNTNDIPMVLKSILSSMVNE
ncbi:AAA domain-containing protein [Lentinula lateritia]|uniref:AAA domain-containing protein n=1 Tax=Lentinula lateritia TaxID=40482 RepID=A0ABQ8VXC2_9AGAR|nr:AAA domain-containing protein [Lentinula lateritia]